VHERSLELPAPIRDVRTLRTLALIDLESHPPDAAIDRVAIAIDPTPGRVLQHTLFTPACPTPDEISTLLARLGALMGQDRIGAPATVDTYRPGAFAVKPFRVERDRDDQRRDRHDDQRRDRREHRECFSRDCLSSVVRRYRQPVPARVAVNEGRPVRVTTERRGIAGGSVIAGAGPWRTSGNWWEGAGRAGGEAPAAMPSRGQADPRRGTIESTRRGWGPGARGKELTEMTHQAPWNRDEWDVALSDGAVYRVFQDRETGGWFIEGMVD
jgi:protein ImuB